MRVLPGARADLFSAGLTLALPPVPGLFQLVCLLRINVEDWLDRRTGQHALGMRTAVKQEKRIVFETHLEKKKTAIFDNAGGPWGQISFSSVRLLLSRLIHLKRAHTPPPPRPRPPPPLLPPCHPSLLSHPTPSFAGLFFEEALLISHQFAQFASVSRILGLSCEGYPSTIVLAVDPRRSALFLSREISAVKPARKIATTAH